MLNVDGERKGISSSTDQSVIGVEFISIIIIKIWYCFVVNFQEYSEYIIKERPPNLQQQITLPNNNNTNNVPFLLQISPLTI